MAHWAQKARKETMEKARQILKDMTNPEAVELKRYTSVLDYNLGVAEPKALEYVGVFVNMGIAEVKDGKIRYVGS